MDPATKDFFQSKTTWGVMLPAINMILQHFGIHINATDATLDAFVNGVGSALFVWGQLSRTATISSVAGIKVTS